MRTVLCVPGAAENPYQQLLARALEPHGYRLRIAPLSWRIERRAGESLVHLHWLAPLFSDPRPVRTALKLALFRRGLERLKRRGVPLVWTVHNLHEHERRHPRLERELQRWLAREAAVLVVHGPSAAERVRRELELPPSKEIAVVPHGHYIGAYGEVPTRSEARRRLGLDREAPIALFLGQIRGHKGVLPLLEAFERPCADRARARALRLVIAGRAHPPELEEELRSRAARIDGLDLRLGFVPDGEIATHVAACDLFVLPHREVLTSGSAVLAMSLGRACIAPRTGCFLELLGDEGAFLFDPERENGLAEALGQALAGRARWEEMGRRNLAAIRPFGWDRVAALTAALYTRASRAASPE